MLLSIAAIGSQFSAAVADTAGGAGLIEDITGQRLPVKLAYLLIMLVTVALTWETDVNGIIAYASRAFALFYTLQCFVAAIVAARQKGQAGRGARVWFFVAIGTICLLVFALGLPSE